MYDVECQTSEYCKNHGTSGCATNTFRCTDGGVEGVPTTVTVTVAKGAACPIVP